ncbi:hypothetical protein CsatB_010028 [Cannabis sativa]
MGSSRDLAVGTVAVGSLLTASMLGQEVSFTENPSLYLHLAFTATFFAGVRPKPISLNGQRLLFVSFQQTSLLLFDGKDVTVNASKIFVQCRSIVALDCSDYVAASRFLLRNNSIAKEEIGDDIFLSCSSSVVPGA